VPHEPTASQFPFIQDNPTPHSALHHFAQAIPVRGASAEDGESGNVSHAVKRNPPWMGEDEGGGGSLDLLSLRLGTYLRKATKAAWSPARPP